MTCCPCPCAACDCRTLARKLAEGLHSGVAGRDVPGATIPTRRAHGPTRARTLRAAHQPPGKGLQPGTNDVVARREWPTPPHRADGGIRGCKLLEADDEAGKLRGGPARDALGSQAVVHVVRGEQAESCVVVLLVVPAEEFAEEAAGVLETAEAQGEARPYPYGGRRAGPLEDGRALCSAVVASVGVSGRTGRTRARGSGGVGGAPALPLMRQQLADA